MRRQLWISAAIALLAASPSSVVAFAPSTTTTAVSTGPSLSRPVDILVRSALLLSREDDEENAAAHSSSSSWSSGSRRLVLSQGLGLVAAATAVSPAFFVVPPVALAAASANGIGSSPDHPIVILGAGGKVGKSCAQFLANQGLYARAVTRSGRTVLTDGSDFVSYAAGDVTKPDSVAAAVQGASGVIFAASASGAKNGGDPAHVDYLGVYNTAQACLAAGVPKLVLISAGTVTRPDSAGFKATNFFVKYVYGDKIMDYKIAGEAIVRDLYSQEAKAGQAYTVIRPGGLNEKASVGPLKVHVSQGDVYSSEVTREDVALVAVAALLKGSATDYCTFELNQIEGLGKAMASLPDLPSELVHAGAPSYDALLDGLLTDAQLKAKYPTLINDFRGDNIEPVSKLL